MQRTLTLSTPDGGLPCQASKDSILDYGQYEILSMGNFLCSAPTLNSTMDFSGKHVEDRVVDSLPEKKPCLPVSCLPSPLRSREVCRLSISPTASDIGTQRKLYGDANYAISEEKSQTPDESRANFVELYVVPLPHSYKYVLSTERYLKRKLGGSSHVIRRVQCGICGSVGHCKRSGGSTFVKKGHMTRARIVEDLRF